MKLCRFEVKAEPGIIRTGMLYSGKIYETDGESALGMYEVSDVRPLPPVAGAPSIRLFGLADEEGAYAFVYANPAALVGPSQLVPLPVEYGPYAVRTYLAAIVGESLSGIDEEDAERAVVGYTLMTAVCDEPAARRGSGAALDFGLAIGPVLTTPDELEDVMDDRGMMLAASLTLNGEERGARPLLPLLPTLPQAISAASRTAPLRAGDVIGVGPLFDPALTPVGEGDEVRLAVERLGTLATKIASPTLNEITLT